MAASIYLSADGCTTFTKPLFHCRPAGKVREPFYDWRFAPVVATDRISAFELRNAERDTAGRGRSDGSEPFLV